MFLEFLETVTGIFVVVYDGQHALKYTLGRAQEVVGPGVHFKLPIVQRFAVRETKHTTLDLEPQVIQLDDALVYEVDAKVMYQIVDLKKALIEIDDLVTGLQNRVVMAVQRVIQARDRETIRDTESLLQAIRAELRPVEDQWGVRILQLGFSNLSPSPGTLEITQLDLLTGERSKLYEELTARGIGREAAVALVTGAVVATHAEVPEERSRVTPREEDRLRRRFGEHVAEAQAEQAGRRKEQGERERRGAPGDDPARGGGEEEGEGAPGGGAAP